MGTCIQPPRVNRSAWSRYAQSPIKQQPKKNKDQQLSQISSIKPEPLKYRSSKFQKYKQYATQDQQTVQKNKIKMITSFKFDQPQTTGKQTKQSSQKLYRTSYKPLNIEQMLNKSKESKQSFRQSKTFNKSPPGSYIRQTKIKKISQLSEQSQIIEPSSFPKIFRNQHSQNREYSFHKNNNIFTHIKDLDIDIHIEPPKQNQGHFSMKQATFQEESNTIPNKPQELTVSNAGYSYFPI